MAMDVASDDGAVENVQGGEHGRGAVAFVVVGHGAEPAFFSCISRDSI
jgi:hypothetical protein